MLQRVALQQSLRSLRHRIGPDILVGCGGTLSHSRRCFFLLKQVLAIVFNRGAHILAEACHVVEELVDRIFRCCLSLNTLIFGRLRAFEHGLFDHVTTLRVKV